MLLTEFFNYRKSKMLVINPIGGLANRMRAIAAGVTLAQDLGADFRIIWAMNSELYARFEDIFEVPAILKDKIYYPGKWEYEFLYKPPRKQNLFLSGLFLRRFQRKLQFAVPGWDITENEAKEPLLKFYRNGDFKIAYIQGCTDFYTYDLEFYRSLFVPVKSIRAGVETVIGKIGPLRTGVHIRRTDNIDSINHSPLEAFVAKIENILKKTPDMKFYLASDSEDVKTYFKKKYPDSFFCYERPAKRTTKDGIYNAARELMILSRCQRIIGSYYSSFSEAAAKCGDIPLSVIYTE